MTKQDRKLTAIIFSKDRALQVDGLLRSIKDHWTIPLKDTVVIAKATSQRFAEGYRKVVQRHPEVTWVDEASSGGFRAALDAEISRLSYDEDVVFWTDDDIVYQPLLWGPEVYQAWDPTRHLFLSTRLDRTFKLAHADDIPEDQRTPPPFKSDQAKPFLEWSWKDAPCTPWNYSFSVEGTIYASELLKRMHSEIGYRAPNTYEREGANWCNHAQEAPLGALAPLQACTFGNNVNITQTEWLTPVGKHWTMETTNDAWLDQEKILNLPWFYAQDITDCHHILESEEILCKDTP